MKEYYNEPKRGYGSNVTDVFAALRATKFQDVYAPAGIQFGGRGSYGNGGEELRGGVGVEMGDLIFIV